MAVDNNPAIRRNEKAQNGSLHSPGKISGRTHEEKKVETHHSYHVVDVYDSRQPPP
jgi:hypothetical protein